MQSAVKVGRFGLSVELLGRSPTGSSFSARACTPYRIPTLYHFVPHLSPKSFIVKQKLEGA
jgi:hypothetical protein